MKTFLALAFLLVATAAFPSVIPNEGPFAANVTGGSDLPMLQAGYFGGDMKGFDPETMKNAIIDERLKWPNGQIPFVIDPSLSQVTNLIYQAMQHYHQYTCIRFVERTYENDYIYITKDNGCFSNVGRIGGVQEVSLGDGCHYMGTVLHELLHAVGFWHEQNRPDRDEYVVVYEQNIQQGMESNFRKFGYNEVQLLNEHYDIESVMQYGETAFSKDGVSPTMKALSGVRIRDTWEKYNFSPSDQRRIQRLYGC
jgi:hypothetical protein